MKVSYIIYKKNHINNPNFIIYYIIKRNNIKN